MLKNIFIFLFKKKIYLFGNVYVGRQVQQSG